MSITGLAMFLYKILKSNSECLYSLISKEYKHEELRVSILYKNTPPPFLPWVLTTVNKEVNQ